MTMRWTLLKQALYFLSWLAHDNFGEYKFRSYLPKHEIDAIVRTFYPAIASFFESEEGNREFEKWKPKKEAEKALIKKSGEQTIPPKPPV